MSKVSDGWFDRQQVQRTAQAVLTEVAQPAVAGRSLRYAERRAQSLQARSRWFLVGVAAFILAVLLIPDLLPGEWLAEGNNLYSVVRWIMIIVPIGFAIAAGKRLRRANQRADVHDTAVRTLASQFETVFIVRCHYR